MTTVVQDVRYALRQLRKSPGFLATAVLTLALGIGANAAIFTLLNAVLMRSLPVADPKMLVRVGDRDQCCVGIGAQGDDGDYSYFPTETWRRLKKNAPEFEELAAMQAGFAYRPVTVRRDGERAGARSMRGEFVSGNYFRTFGLRPHTGRLLTDADDVAGAPMVAIMSYGAWQRDYAGDPAVVGGTFWVNTRAVTVAGIAPAGFYGDRLISTPPDLYLPIESMPVLTGVTYVDDPDARWLYLVGRVNPDVNLAALQAKLSGLVRQAFGDSPSFSKGAGKQQLPKVHVVLTQAGGGIQHLQGEYASNLKMLLTISGLVLVIACANIANLLLARGMSRRTEMSVRTALGAGRGRTVRQLLTESLALSLLGGAAGLAAAYPGARMLVALAFPGAESVPIQASPSLAVLAFACGLSLLTGVLFGVAPAWAAARADPAEALRSGARMTGGGGASLVQRGLVVVQAALSLVLLVGALLFTQSLGKLEHMNLHLEAKNRYIVHINPQAAGYSPAQVDGLYRRMVERFHAVPGVVKVGISSYTPMEDNNWGTGIHVQGKPDPHDFASFVRVSPEFFDAVGTRVTMGRGILERDRPGAPVVALVNQAFLKKFFNPGENPLGRHFGTEDPASWGDYEIVGVVEDTTYETPRLKDHAMYFLTLAERPASSKDPIEQDTSLYAGAIVIQTDHAMGEMEALARQTLASINPNLTVVKFQTFAGQIADTFTDDRLVARLTMLFGALALALAAIGLYGVTAYTVALRASEIGIRMAVGADRGGVTRMVMRGAIVQTALGLAFGIPAALVSVRFIEAQLYEIRGVDLRVMTIAILTLTLAACAAGLIPAQRAASTDPAKALRTE